VRSLGDVGTKENENPVSLALQTLPMKPHAQQSAAHWRQTTLVIIIGGHSDGFGLGRIRSHHLGQLSQAYPRSHRQRYLIDHLTGMPSDDCGAKYLVATITDVDFHETTFLTVDDRAINVMQRDSKRLDPNVAFPRLFDIEANVGNLWVSVGAPRNPLGAHSFSTGEESIAND
jgi:hypothetical protein